MTPPRPSSARPARLLRTATRAASAALVLAGAAACADAPTAVGAAAGPHFDAGPATGGSSSSRLVSNEVKYQDRGAHPATGRSGSAALTSWALVDVAGRTIVTADADPYGGWGYPGAPTGTLAHVRVSARTAAGRPVGGTLTFNPGTVSLSQPLPMALAPGAVATVQANVRGLDGSRTDVVTAVDTVRRAPDLRVRWAGLSPAAAGRVTQITAVVSERNGEVGARANCVLYVDGAAVDRSEGVWVDAGGRVACGFAHVFAAAGTARVRVAASDVAPLEYDPADNAVDSTITVFDPAQLPVRQDGMAFGFARAFQQTGWSEYRYVSRLIYANGDRDSSAFSHVDSTYRLQGAVLDAHLAYGALLPVSGLDVTVSNGGRQTFGRSAPLPSDMQVRGNLGAGQACALVLEPGLRATVCSRWGAEIDAQGRRSGSTDVNVQHSREDILYVSASARATYFAATGATGGYSYLTVGDRRDPTFTPWVRGDVRVAAALTVGGAQQMVARATVPLQLAHESVNKPFACSTFEFGQGASLLSCSGDRSELDSAFGEATQFDPAGAQP